MKMVDTQTISAELRRNFRSLAERAGFLHRDTVTILTTRLRDFYIRVPRGSMERKILACVSWYLPDELRVYVQEELLNICERRLCDPTTEIQLNVLLSCEGQMICYIMESNVLGNNPNEVFGNIRATKINFSIILPRVRNARRLIRRRGYRDKGALGKYTAISKEEKKDLILTELQNMIEYERILKYDAIHFALGFTE